MLGNRSAFYSGSTLHFLSLAAQSSRCATLNHDGGLKDSFHQRGGANNHSHEQTSGVADIGHMGNHTEKTKKKPNEHHSESHGSQIESRGRITLAAQPN